MENRSQEDILRSCLLFLQHQLTMPPNINPTNRNQPPTYAHKNHQARQTTPLFLSGSPRRQREPHSKKSQNKTLFSISLPTSFVCTIFISRMGRSFSCAKRASVECTLASARIQLPAACRRMNTSASTRCESMIKK